MNQLPHVNNITSKEHWKEATGKTIATIFPDETYRAYFDRYLPKRKEWTVLEVGACPGRHLLTITLNNGYKPTALDYLSDVHLLPAVFRRQAGIDLDVIEADFLTYDSDRKFNVVMSFGFIEHFSDPREILYRQWKLVAKGGFLLVGVPIFGPLQMLLRRIVLTPEKLTWTLKAHNREIMDIRLLRKICESLPECDEVVKASYVRNMDTWFSPGQPYIRAKRGWILYFWRALAFVPKWLNLSYRLFSPYALVIVCRER